MTIKEAISLLEYHNKWRRGAEIDQTDEIKLGQAIDTILKHYHRSMKN